MTALENKTHLHPTNREEGNPAFETLEGRPDSGIVIISDHATNIVPEAYKQLGLPPSEFERHIAYDIGAESLTRYLAKAIGCPAIMSRFSRLLIDPNRGSDDPTLVMRLSDGAIVPGNAQIDREEKQHRIDTYYQPYHDEVARVIDFSVQAGYPPLVFSIHSFTPFWKGVARPWEVGVLWEGDDRFARPLIDYLSCDKSLNVGENEPYVGGIEGESLDKHARARGLSAALIEIRQDLIGDKTGVDEWGNRLAQILPKIHNELKV